jgi:putative salt-induced outer membrane protein
MKEERTNLLSIAVIALLFTMSLPAFAQGQATPVKKDFTGNFGIGFALTGGNTDTKSFNLSFEATHDSKTRNVIKTNGLYLKTNANGESIADLLRLSFRDDYSLSKRVSVYGALGYLRDPFKSINYLLNPQGGIGLKAYTSTRGEFALNGGAGAVWEKNEGFDVRSSATLNAGESFSLKISETAKITQNLTGLWKTSEFADALYHFDVALVTSIVKKVDAKIEFMDDYKNRTPSAAIKKNDTALITSLLYKF